MPTVEFKCIFGRHSGLSAFNYVAVCRSCRYFIVTDIRPLVRTIVGDFRPGAAKTQPNIIDNISQMWPKCGANEGEGREAQRPTILLELPQYAPPPCRRE